MKKAFRNKQRTVLAVAGVFGLALSAAGAAGQPVEAAGNPVVVSVENIQPFTHDAAIPVNVDTSTIRFEKVKATKVPTQIKRTSEGSICDNLTEPGGSMYCPYEQRLAYVDAYDVVYSFAGQADELGNKQTTFHVYLRPEELAPVLKEAIAAKQLNRGKASEYFHVSFIKEPVRRIVVDEAKSSFCPGTFGEEGWMHADARCQDKISYTSVLAPADYLTVRVEPFSIPGVQATNRSAK
jgi:hypothetical protein